MERTITIKGVGHYSAQPDTVEISVFLSGKSPEYEQTVEREAKKYEYLAAAVEKCAIEKNDIKTSSYNVRTTGRYVKNSYVNDGWECTQRVTIRFPIDSGKLSEATAAISGSLSEPNLNVSFTLADTEDAKFILLQNAATDACIKAQLLAKATGVTLGQILTIDYSWSDINFYSDMEYSNMCMSACDSAPDYIPEDIDLNENVTFVWSIS